MWFFLGIGIFFIIIGLLVHVCKFYFLISGYNTMSKEKKAKVDTKGLARLMGIYAYVNGGVYIIAGLLQGLGIKVVMVPAIVFFIISTIAFLVRAQKFDGNLFDKEGKFIKGAGKQLAIPGVIMVITLIFVGVLLFLSSRPTEVKVMAEGIEISGMYGDVYKWSSIDEVELIDKLPNIELRTNGSALGSSLKGYFKTTELGKVKLFVDADKSPFIYLQTDKGKVIFNLDSSKETRNIYDKIQRELE